MLMGRDIVEGYEKLTIPHAAFSQKQSWNIDIRWRFLQTEAMQDSEGSKI